MASRQLQKHFNALLATQTIIVDTSDPFINGNLIESTQRDTMRSDIKRLRDIINSACDLLNTTGKNTLSPFPLQRLQLIAKLDNIKQWGERLETHITDLPVDGQTFSTSRQRRLVHRDVERLQESLQEALPMFQIIQPLRLQQITSVAELLNESQDE